jgi:hypothetical protein
VEKDPGPEAGVYEALINDLYTTEELYRTLAFSFSRRRAMRSPGVRGTWDWRREELHEVWK